MVCGIEDPDRGQLLRSRHQHTRAARASEIAPLKSRVQQKRNHRRAGPDHQRAWPRPPWPGSYIGSCAHRQARETARNRSGPSRAAVRGRNRPCAAFGPPHRRPSSRTGLGRGGPDHFPISASVIAGPYGAWRSQTPARPVRSTVHIALSEDVCATSYPEAARAGPKCRPHEIVEQRRLGASHILRRIIRSKSHARQKPMQRFCASRMGK